MRRKDIVRSMQSWFEVTNSGLSKAIRSMARPPLSFVEIDGRSPVRQRKAHHFNAKG